MGSKSKNLVTRQETINNYKTDTKPSNPSSSQIFGLVPETKISKLQHPPKSLRWIPQYSLYAACDEKSFYLFNRFGKLRNSASFIEDFKIPTCLTFIYIDKYHCFALISSDLKLLLISILLDIWKVFPLTSRINHIEFHNSLLFLGGTSKIAVMSLMCDTKYDIEKSLLLDPDRGFVTFKLDAVRELSFNVKWIKGMKVSLQTETLLVWSECTVTIFNINSCKIKAEGEDLCPGTLITEILYTLPQDFLIAATMQGSIYIYKLGASFKLIHTFTNHTRSVMSIALFGTNFVSASIDFTVKMWSLEHFRLLYTFEIASSTPMNYLSFINPTSLASISKNQLLISRLNLIGKTSFITVSPIKHLRLIDDKIAAIGEDNSIVLYESGKVLTTIYPPPSAHDLTEILYLEKLKRVLVLLDSGVICLFSVEGETGLLERIIRTGDITDYEARPVQSQIKCIKLVECIPPQYDCELVFRKHSSFESVPEEFLAVAIEKGILLFVAVESIDKIYARFSLHRETIKVIEEIPGHMITLCLANVLIISVFENNILVKLKKFDLKANVLFLKGLKPNKFLISFNTGQTEVIEVFNNKIQRYINKENDSDSLLTSVTIVQENEIFGMASNNKKVQIYTFNKQLLYEITFPHSITSLLIVNESVIVAYKQIATTVKVNTPYPLSIIDTEEITENYFKNVFTHQRSISETSPLPFIRENTPEKMHVLAKVFDLRPKLKSEAGIRKKKPVPKKLKRKRNEHTAVPDKRKRNIIDADMEMYRKVISQKIPVITQRRPMSNNALLTRRQLTEEKICENVRRHGDPADKVDYTGLCVVDETLYFGELAKLRGSQVMLQK